MKAYSIILLWLFLMAGGLSAQYDGNFERVLEAYIKEDNRTADKSTRDQIASNWSGINTMDGVRSMVRELLKPTGGDRRSRTFAILHRSKVPREQVVTYLLESAEANRRDPEMLCRHFPLFTDYPEDIRILKFLARLLSDKGVPDPIRKPEPREERGNEARWRMCDAAHGAITQILEKRGEIKPGDPGYGDPGGEATIGKREINVAELETILVRSGYLGAAAAKPPLDTPPATSKSPPQANLAIGIFKDDEPEPKPPVAGIKVQPPSQGVSWILWMFGVVIVLTVILLLVWKRRT